MGDVGSAKGSYDGADVVMVVSCPWPDEGGGAEVLYDMNVPVPVPVPVPEPGNAPPRDPTRMVYAGWLKGFSSVPAVTVRSEVCEYVESVRTELEPSVARASYSESSAHESCPERAERPEREVVVDIARGGRAPGTRE